MIEELRITDLGVIEHAQVPLSPGLTAITGETGAGKTMVLSGLALILGGRADAAVVRVGAERAGAEGRSWWTQPRRSPNGPGMPARSSTRTAAWWRCGPSRPRAGPAPCWAATAFPPRCWPSSPTHWSRCTVRPIRLDCAHLATSARRWTRSAVPEHAGSSPGTARCGLVARRRRGARRPRAARRGPGAGGRAAAARPGRGGAGGPAAGRGPGSRGRGGAPGPPGGPAGGHGSCARVAERSGRRPGWPRRILPGGRRRRALEHVAAHDQRAADLAGRRRRSGTSSRTWPPTWPGMPTTGGRSWPSGSGAVPGGRSWQRCQGVRRQRRGVLPGSPRRARGWPTWSGVTTSRRARRGARALDVS